MELIIRPEAEMEMAEAFAWYEARVPGLGSEFLLTVDAIMNAILRNPQQYPVVHKNLRRAITRRFPYQVIFIVEEKQIVVIAVFHAKRNPDSWQKSI